MATQRTKFSVGLFLASGMAIGVLAFIWLGMSRFLEKGQFYATYFNESVQGLDVDSPVKYRGVSIGRVDRIAVASDSKLIKVVLKVETGMALGSDVVAQLKTVGITGSMFVEMDQRKEGEPDRTPPLSFPSEYPIVASKPSDISVILQGIDDVLSKMKALDVEGISEKVKGNLDRIDQTITDANVKGLSRSISRILDGERWEKIIVSLESTAQSLSALMAQGHKTLEAATQSLERVDGIIVSNQGTIRTALDDFGKAMDNANVLLERGASFVKGTDETLTYLRQNLAVTAQNLEKASENLDRLIELVADHPSQLLFGEPPLPRRTGEGPSQRE